MFLNITDLGANIYEYQIEEITEGNDDIVYQGLQAAEEEIRSYLSGNHKREWKDGRLLYDVDKILSQTGSARNALIVRHGITIAKFYIMDLSNVDIIMEQAKERYDRAIAWLKKLGNGELNLSTLPTIEPDPDDGSSDDTGPFLYGSRTKFTHE
ncbi:MULTISPECIES: phage protein Gp36 family protein [Chryseobacterium]|uniref:DUF1320 domain-containing protein n=1 Tax=Chryseobacterium oncorhynchi TaxID=741074 RepID=A0A316WUP5_9FLAO|nr:MULTISPECIES: phage protein Gp36 family protein [Chryseobacterium]PWN62300.1 hypothetical protein C1638_017560 [Chryseobacterium oncorhynchi]HCM34134.1 hypothetical protein [Chryseobacterium sp.]